MNPCPWKMVALPSSPEGGSQPSSPSKSLKDIMIEEEHKHEKEIQQQQLKEKELSNAKNGRNRHSASEGNYNANDEDPHGQNHKRVERKSFSSNPRQKHHQHRQNYNSSHSNGNNSTNTHNNNSSNPRKPYCKSNISNSQHPRTSYQPTSPQSTSSNNSKRINSNKKRSSKKKSSSRTNYRSSLKSCNYNDALKHQQYAYTDFDIPSFTEMKITSNYELSYVTMSCEEYYEATSYKAMEQIYLYTTKEERDCIVSLDCEMVGVGECGERSALARVCIVNWDYDILLDTYVKVEEPVTDYRTFVSGIRDADLKSDQAMEYRTCRNMVLSILRGKVLVGHGLENDLAALQISHPPCDIRDTAHYPPYMTATLVSPIPGKNNNTGSSISSISSYMLPSAIESDCSSVASTSCSSDSSSGIDSQQQQQDCVNVTYPGPMMQLKSRKLKEIAREWLSISIQKEGAEHSPLEDAQAALGLYKLARARWEKHPGTITEQYIN